MRSGTEPTRMKSLKSTTSINLKSRDIFSSRLPTAGWTRDGVNNVVYVKRRQQQDNKINRNTVVFVYIFLLWLCAPILGNTTFNF